MKSKKIKIDPESRSEFKPASGNLPLYNPGSGNESGFNYRSGKIKSHSFSVSGPQYLAGENIIFEPGDYSGSND